MDESRKLTPFFRFIKLVYKNWKFLIITNLVVFVLAIIFSLFLPKWYEGRVVFIINTDTDMSSSLTSAVLGNVGLPGGLFGTQGLMIADQYLGFLSSRYIIDKIDSVYHLQDDYNIKYRTIFYKRMLQNTLFINNGDNTLTIKFYYKEDPQKAADIANSFYNELSTLVMKLKTENKRKVREFLENTYEKTLRQLSEAEEKFTEFQKLSNLYSFDDQLKLAVTNLYNLEAEKINLEVQKLYLESLGAEKSADYDATIKKIQVLVGTINSIKTEDRYIDIPLEKLPSEGLTYIRLFREIKIMEKILEFVVPQLENARLEEQREISNLQLLDFAAPQDYKAKPKRIIIVFVISFITFITTILIVLIRDFIKRNSDTLSWVLNK